MSTAVRRLLSARQLAAFAAAPAVTAVWATALAWGGELSQLLSNLGLAVAALSAALSCAVTARRCSERVRPVWELLGLSAASWGAGRLAWTWYESVLGNEVPFPSLADIGYLGAVPLAAAALLRLPLGSLTLAGRVRAILDGLLIAASMLLVSWIVVLGPLLRAGADSLLATTISLAHPLGDAVIVTLVLYVVLRARATERRAPVPIAMMGVALSALAVADSGFLYLTLTDSYSSGSVIDAGWFCGYVMLAVAARQPQPDVDEAGEPDRRPLGMLLPYAAVVLAVGVSSLELVRTGAADPFVSWARSVIMICIVARQLLTLRENMGLTRHLEQRVADRTAELLASQQRFEALVQHSHDVVMILDRDAVIRYHTESAARVFGFSPDVVGRTFVDLIHPGDAERFREVLQEAALVSLRIRTIELRVLHTDGRYRDAETTVTNLLDEASVAGLVLNTRDVSERKHLEQQLVYEAFHDSLTGLANRALFEDSVRQALLRVDLAPERVAVLFLDLDGFKEINDSLGHASGDLLLKHVADRLRQCVRSADIVARLGGDEFAVLIEASDGRDHATALAKRITARLRDPFSIDGREIYVRGSVGIAVVEAGVTDSGHLLRNADLAMYRAKADQEGGHVLYNPAMHAHLVERLELETDLRRAIRDGELTVHYQPTIAVASGEIAGVEALVRWQDSTRGPVPPAVFVPLAEDLGLIHELGRQVMDEACRQTAAWRRQFPTIPLSVSVNLSGRQLAREDLGDEILAILDSARLDPRALVLEMTESVLMEHTQENRDRLRRLKVMGIRLAIDDFGTGYSSLSYLHGFPVDILKIDRSFVERLGAPGEDENLVRTIVSLGASLGLETVAEGVENYRQMLSLRRLGCTLAQGYYICRPSPAEDITTLLREHAAAEIPEAI